MQSKTDMKAAAIQDAEDDAILGAEDFLPDAVTVPVKGTSVIDMLSTWSKAIQETAPEGRYAFDLPKAPPIPAFMLNQQRTAQQERWDLERRRNLFRDRYGTRYWDQARAGTDVTVITEEIRDQTGRTVTVQQYTRKAQPLRLDYTCTPHGIFMDQEGHLTPQTLRQAGLIPAVGDPRPEEGHLVLETRPDDV